MALPVARRASALVALFLMTSATASAPSSPGPAASFSMIVVNSTLDLPDANLGDGVPDADLATPGLQTTLRAAIMHANGSGFPQAIDLPAGTYALTLRGSNEDAAATGDLDILGDITLTGAGAAVVLLDAKRLKDRAFDIRPGARLAGRGFTLSSAKAGRGPNGGGGFLNASQLSLSEVVITRCSAPDGGAIEQLEGILILEDAILSYNKANDDGGAIDVDGGGANLRRVTFVGNKASDEGGAYENGSVTGNNTFENVTFSGNKARSGGAFSGEDDGQSIFESCTFVGNKARVGGAIFLEENAGLTITHNSIYGDNGRSNASGALISIGGNLDFGSTCGFGGSDLSNTDPLLAPLADNGGFTPTHALLPGSPCIDAGNDTHCVTQDQRGLPRVDLPAIGSAVCDIGAFEAQS